MDNKTSSRLRGCADLNLRWAHMYVAGHIHLNVNYLNKFKSSCSQSTNFRNVKIPVHWVELQNQKLFGFSVSQLFSAHARPLGVRMSASLLNFPHGLQPACAKSLGRLCGSTGSPEPLLFEYTVILLVCFFPWRGWFILGMTHVLKWMNLHLYGCWFISRPAYHSDTEELHKTTATGNLFWSQIDRHTYLTYLTSNTRYNDSICSQRRCH